MNDKIKDIVVTIIFLFTIIALFLINIIKEDTDISVAERRKLATMPELTTKSLFDGTYFKNFDYYVTDQFVERDAFRKIKIDIELSTKGEYNNLYLYDDYIIEEIFPLNSNSINNLTSKINYIKDTYLNDNNNIYYIANKIVLDSGDSRKKIKTNGTRATKFRQRNISQTWGNI